MNTHIYCGNKNKKDLKNKSTISRLILQLNGGQCKGASIEEILPLFFKPVTIAVALQRRFWNYAHFSLLARGINDMFMFRVK